MPEKLGLIDAISIGIGAMIGGGIFSVMGLAVLLAGSAAPISFLLGGIIALLVGYSYVKLSTTYTSEGGSFSYIAQAFNPRVGGFGGWLLCIGYIGTLALYAYAFGSYGAAMLGLGNLGTHLLQSVVIIVFMIINLIGAKEVGKIENIIVAVKVAILGFFIAAGFFLSTSFEMNVAEIEFGGMLMATALIFVAFEGFQLIPQGIKEMKDPKKNIRRGIYISIISVMIIYALISLIVTHKLSFEEIELYQEYVLAATAQPLLGNIGFLLIGFAALLSTTSAINATIFGTSRLSYIMATKKELPRFFSIRDKEKQIPSGAIIGISIIALLFVNFGSLVSIASVASSIFLVIFLLINLSVIRRKKEVNANYILPGIGSFFTTILLISLLIHLYRSDIHSFVIVGGVFISTFILEHLFKKTEMIREELVESAEDISERVIADRLQEHDLQIRKKLVKEIGKSKSILKNIQGIVKNSEDFQSIMEVIDALDVFSNDIEFSISGKKYPIFSIQNSTLLNRLVKHDEEIIENMKRITASITLLETNVIENKNLDLYYELRKLISNLTNIRNDYRNRAKNKKGV